MSLGATIAAILLMGHLSAADLLDHPAIKYGSGPLNDPVAVLNRKLDQGQIQLKFDGPAGYLRSVLAALKVPIESQIAVFRKPACKRP